MKNQLHKKVVNYSLTLLIFITLLGHSALGQVQNALSFDGVDDNVVVPAASSLIANTTTISMSLWVYPQNAAPAWPDYDGFAGFRNDADADFYFAQVTASNVECRFRNSAGNSFDITDTQLQLNTWQHYVVTYDGSDLKVYYNGVLSQSTPATGLISNSTENLLIGDQKYFITEFFLDGKIDEFTLWDKALTPSEVSCIYMGNVDSNDTNLKLYYKFNQGVAGGNNVAVSTLLDAAGTLNGDLMGFALNGPSSNWVASSITSSLNISAGMCPGDSYVFGSQVLTTPGVYIDTLTSVSGCDSIVTLTLTVSSVDTSVNLFSTVLHSNQAGATYQWVDCNNNYAVIPGATSQNLTLTTGGNYAVIVSLNGCTDTSSCHNVTFAGIEENNVANYVHLYPNPVTDYLTINLDKQLHNADVQLSDVEGRIMWSDKNSNNLRINVAQWSAGIYFIKVTTANGTANFKLQKQ